MWVGIRHGEWPARMNLCECKFEGGGGRRNTNFQLTYYTRDRPKIIGTSLGPKNIFGSDVGIVRRPRQRDFRQNGAEWINL